MTPNESHFYSIGNNQLHYIVFGSGSELLITFHGFGDSALLFKNVEEAFIAKYTVVSVDLPFHGLSHWTQDELLTLPQLLVFIDYVQNVFQKDKFDLAGFSLGGKVSLAVYDALPGKVNAIWLFAPDGLKNNIWYNIAVYPKAGQRLFKNVLHNPNLFLSFARILAFMRVIRRQYVQFLEKQLDSEAKRMLVWNIWMCLRGYERSKKHLKFLIQRHQTKVFVFVGRYDQIIKPSFGKKFCEGLSSAELVVLDKGHYLLKDYLNKYIAERL